MPRCYLYNGMGNQYSDKEFYMKKSYHRHCLLKLVALLLISSKCLAAEIMPIENKGKWQFDDIEFSIEIACFPNTNFFSSEECGKPELSVKTINQYKKNRKLYKISMQGNEFGDTWAFNPNISYNSPEVPDNIEDSNVSSPEIMELALKATNQNPIKLYTREDLNSPIKESEIVLSKLSNQLLEKYNSEKSSAKNQAELKTNESLKNLLFSIFLFSLTIIIVVWCHKRSLKNAKLDREAAHKTRVKRIAEDEAIRSAVRKKMDEAEDSLVENFNNQVRDALHPKDGKAAENLLKVMNQKKQKN